MTSNDASRIIWNSLSVSVCAAPGVRDGMGDAGARNVEPDPEHRFLEKLAVLAFRDGLRVRADEPDVMPGECAVAVQFHRNVERRLSAHCRQDRVRFFPLE